MKCSWHRTCIKVFRPDLPRGGSWQGENRSQGPLQKTSSDQKATATYRMYNNDLEACWMKCSYFWFHSEVKFFMRSLFSGERQWPFWPLVTGKVFQQIVGIPMGTNCVPLLADIFLYSYEAKFIQTLLSTDRKQLASRFNFTYR